MTDSYVSFPDDDDFVIHLFNNIRTGTTNIRKIPLLYYIEHPMFILFLQGRDLVSAFGNTSNTHIIDCIPVPPSTEEDEITKTTNPIELWYKILILQDIN